MITLSTMKSKSNLLTILITVRGQHILTNTEKLGNRLISFYKLEDKYTEVLKVL